MYCISAFSWNKNKADSKLAMMESIKHMCINFCRIWVMPISLIQTNKYLSSDFSHLENLVLQSKYLSSGFCESQFGVRAWDALPQAHVREATLALLPQIEAIVLHDRHTLLMSMCSRVGIVCSTHNGITSDRFVWAIFLRLIFSVARVTVHQ